MAYLMVLLALLAACTMVPHYNSPEEFLAAREAAIANGEPLERVELVKEEGE